MENISVEKLEAMLAMSPEEVGKHIDMKRAGIYKVRRLYPKKYKITMLGIRLINSPLKLKEILDVITPIEKIVKQQRNG